MKWKWKFGQISLISLKEHLLRESIPYHKSLNGTKEEMISLYQEKIKELIEKAWGEVE